MQQSCLISQRGVHPISTQVNRLPVSVVRPKPRLVTRDRCHAGNSIFQPLRSLNFSVPLKHSRPLSLSRVCQVLSHSTAEPVLDASRPARLQEYLPVFKIVVAVVCLPLLLHNLWVSQQQCLLSMAGIFLPLQAKHTHQSLKRFQHALKAAAAVEQETEEGGKPEPEAEEVNDNTIIETGAELGNVQTPASVWLPYATNQNGKVSSLIQHCTGSICCSGLQCRDTCSHLCLPSN